MSNVESILCQLQMARRITWVTAFLVVISLAGIVVYGYWTLNSMPSWHNFRNIVEREKALKEDLRKDQAAP